jgi:transposase
MFYVGIDIAKFKHDFCIISDTGEVIVPPTTIMNSKEGFTTLLKALSNLDRSYEMRIGLEATGHYGSNLKIFLSSHGFQLIELNPLRVKRFHSQTSLRRTKTDKIDCMLIARFLSEKTLQSYHPSLYHLEALKRLTRLRDTYVRQRSLYLVKLTNVLDLVFPEFRQFFSNKFKSETALFILRKYMTPAKIAHWTNKDITLIHNKSRRFPPSKILRIQQAAMDTVGNSSPYLVDEMLSILNVYEDINTEVMKVESKIMSIMNEIDSPTASIPGIGLMSAATIISEFGDFSRFPSYTQCIAYAGLDVGISQSGTKSYRGKMVKRGSPHLRYALMTVAATVSLHVPTLKTFWIKKRKEGKFSRIVDSHVAKKLIRIIYHLETNQLKFDSQLCK